MEIEGVHNVVMLFFKASELATTHVASRASRATFVLLATLLLMLVDHLAPVVSGGLIDRLVLLYDEVVDLLHALQHQLVELSALFVVALLLLLLILCSDGLFRLHVHGRFQQGRLFGGVVLALLSVDNVLNLRIDFLDDGVEFAGTVDLFEGDDGLSVL